MNGTKVGAARPNNDALDNTPASFLNASAAYLPIGMMVILEVTFFSPDVSVVGHGISAEVNAFSQSLFSRPKHRLKIFLRYSAWVRERMNSGAPQDFIGVDITDTCYERLVHEYLLYLSPRLFL